jgi:fructose-bisphosphate aldolase/2-amino-3,7-dideoxy-D-threo-hept-6-ulosonate synthase
MKRLDQIMGKDAWRAFVINMDRGITIGQAKGLNKVREVLTKLPSLGVSSVLVPKGLVGICYAGAGRGLGLIVNLSSLGDDHNSLPSLDGINEALRMGADAVSINMNLVDEGSSKKMREIASIAERCDSWGIPLLIRIDSKMKSPKYNIILDAVVSASELGASLIASPYVDNPDDFKELIRSCGKPVLLSVNNSIGDFDEVKDSVKKSIRGGGSGIVLNQDVLRNLEMTETIKDLTNIVFE